MTFSKVDLVNFRHKLVGQNFFLPIKLGRDTTATKKLRPKKLITKAHEGNFTETILKTSLLNPINIIENNVDWKIYVSYPSET